MKKLWVADDEHGPRSELTELAELNGVSIRKCSKRQLDARLPGARHQWIAAEINPADYVDWPELLEHENPLVVAVDQVTDPRNLGAILRSGEGMGVTGALLTRNRCARLGPTVAKTSAGASELVPVAMEANLARSLRQAQQSGLQIVGADFDGVPPSTIDLTGPTVLVIGAEGRGLRRLTRETCDTIATIPMSGLTDSLNAGTAAGIMIYEACRQRREQAIATKGKKIS